MLGSQPSGSKKPFSFWVFSGSFHLTPEEFRGSEGPVFGDRVPKGSEGCVQSFF